MNTPTLRQISWTAVLLAWSRRPSATKPAAEPRPRVRIAGLR
jgi:hypothetical protein